MRFERLNQTKQGERKMNTNKTLISQLKKVLEILEKDETNSQFHWDITLSRDRESMTLRWYPSRAVEWELKGEIGPRGDISGYTP